MAKPAGLHLDRTGKKLNKKMIPYQNGKKAFKIDATRTPST